MGVILSHGFGIRQVFQELNLEVPGLLTKSTKKGAPLRFYAPYRKAPPRKKTLMPAVLGQNVPGREF